MHWRGFFTLLTDDELWVVAEIVSSQLQMNIGDMDIFGGLVQELCLVYSQQVSVHPDYMSSHRIGYLEKKMRICFSNLWSY